MFGGIVASVFVLLCSFVPVSCQMELEAKPDWSPYTVIDTFQDLNKSTDLVMNLTMWQYWDTERAEYGVGPIASELSSTLFADFISQKDKKTFVDGVVYVTPNVSVVDTDSLLWHMIASLQNMYKTKLEHSVLVARLLEEKHDFAKKIVRVAEETGKEWRTASEMRANVDIIEERIIQVNSQLEKEKDRSSWRMENRRYRHEQRRKLRMQHDRNMTMDLEWNGRVQLKLHEDKSNGMFDVFVEGMHLDKDLELRDFEEDFNGSKAMLLKSNNLSVESVIFRVQEETKMERENEKVFVNLAIARTKSAESQMEALVEVVFREVITYGSAAVQNPAAVLSWSGALCGVLLVVTLLNELGIICKFYLMKRFSSNTVTQTPASGEKTDAHIVSLKRPEGALPLTRANDSAIDKAISRALDDIVLLPACSSPLRQYLSCFLAVRGEAAPEHGAVQLPNALFTGPTGIGKSLTAAAIGQLLASAGDGKNHCKFDVITVCGADMLALGPGAAGAYLRELFLRSGSEQNSFHKTLVIIDEADVMIGRRGKPATTNTRNSFSPVNASPKKKTSGRGGDDGSNGGETVSITEKPSFSAGAPTASASNGASDGSCLYQILCACRVNNPNLAVLLTTTQKVSGIDPAILDRMDYTVEYSNPTAVLCAHYLLQCIYELLFVYIGSTANAESSEAVKPADYSAAQRTLVKLMEHDAKVYDEMSRNAESAPSVGESAINSPSADADEPVDGVKASAKKVKAGSKAKTSVRNSKARPSLARSVSVDTASSKKLNGSDWDGWSDYCSAMRIVSSDAGGAAGDGVAFSTLENIIRLVESMPTATAAESVDVSGQLWSYREMLKFVRNIQCDILGTESCELTDEKWHQVLDVTVQNKNRSANSSWS